MLFNYKAIDSSGNEKSGSIDAISETVAVSALQRRGLVISSIIQANKENSFFGTGLSLFNRVSVKDIVILSRQVAVLFEAEVSALRVFRLLAQETPKPLLRETLTQVADDLQGGSSINKALLKHPKIFSPFYVNMVRAGEESGRLSETLLYLADYLDRSYEVTSKARNALIYPAFVITVFIVVLVLMLTLIIPKISPILLEAGENIPIYTRVVIGISDFFVNYGLFLAGLFVLAGFGVWRFSLTSEGKETLSRLKLEVPYIGTLYQKLYLSRLADNLSTMLSSGIAMVDAIEVTASVVDNRTYEKLLMEAAESVKNGKSVSDSLGSSPEIPSIMVQMIKIGEETGELGSILKTLSKFYQREVTNAVDSLVDLIEPVMIVVLGLGVGFLLISVLGPIYSLTSAF